MPFTLTEQSIQLTKLEDLIGRQIVHAETVDNHLVIQFHDDTWVQIESEGYDDDAGKTLINKYPPLDWEKMHLGMITLEECRRRDAERNAKHQADSDKREIAEYERLKAKFEGTGNEKTP